ncbi:MAG: hypothetical protein RJA10_3294 [Pseudomonadota bacterium]|jgi:hypothetical protein
MTHRLNTTASRPLRSLLALAAAAATFGAQAVTVNVSISGLPPGLAPVVEIKRNVCPDGMGWATNPTQALTESSQTLIEPVTLPSGQTTFRSRIITRYTASFDTPATPTAANRTIAYDVRCSEVAMGADQFQFTLKVPGQDANDQPANATHFLGFTSQTGPLSISRTMSARTTSFTPGLSVLTRNVVTTMDAAYSTTIGTIQGQRLEFLRPSTLIPGAFSRTATLFVREGDNAACVQAGSTTRCLAGATPVDAAGVRLRALTRGANGSARFQFDLLPTFPVGTLKLRATAEASDLAEYIVDGTPQVLDLLPVVPMDQTVTVQ